MRTKGPMRRFLIACCALIAVASGPGAWAQSVNSGEVASVVGATDGRRLGLSQGRVEGRAQALYESFRVGFRSGLEESTRPGVGSLLAGRLRLEGQEGGREQGREAGREAGGDAALANWLETGAPAPRPRTGPAPAPTRETPALCTPAGVLRLQLVREYRVEIDPDGLEKRESPVVVDAFDLAFPPTDDLRARARAAGATAEAVDFWVRDYESAFQSAWHESFENERSGTPLPDRKELEGLGLDVGRKEGERRLVCEVGEREWQDGFAAGWAEGWSAAFEEAWTEADERHSERAVVVVQAARLVDASGDGLLEPGEGLRLEARLVNAGAVEAQRSAGSWEALRGLESEGHFEGGLGAGESRDLKLELGEVDAEAPAGTSVVLRVRGLGSEPITVHERLGRPALIEAADARLEIESGRVVARVEVLVRSVSPASSRALLEIACDDVRSEVGRLQDGESKTVVLVLPAALPETIGSQAMGALVLRTSEGLPWHAGRWSAPLGLDDALAMAGTKNAPAEAGAVLLRHLKTEWEEAVAQGERDSTPAALEAYATALSALAPEARQRVDERVTTPLLELIEGTSGARRVKKRTRELLAG